MLFAGGRAGFWRRGVVYLRVRVLAQKWSGFAAVVAAQPGDNAIEVRAKGRRRPVATGSAENPQKRLLGDVFRRVKISDKTECGIPSGTLMSAYKLLKGGQVALSHRRH